MIARTLCTYAKAIPSKWYVDSYDFDPGVGSEGFRCSYCPSKVRMRVDANDKTLLCDCEACGYWRVIHLQIGGFHSAREVPAMEGIIKEYPIDALDIPLNDLKRFLKRNPKHLGHVNPSVFEELVAECLRAAYSPCEVINVGGVRDGGVDLLLMRTNSETYMVQVKRRSNINSTEGVEVVRFLNGTLFRKGKSRGMVVTTAKRFSKDAVDELDVQTPTETRYEVLLRGYDHIVDWLSLPTLMPYEPWVAYYPEVRFEKRFRPD